MRVMTIKEAVDFLNAPSPSGLGMNATISWVRWMAEPDADGRRRLPFFKAPGGGRTTKLLTTDEALREHFKRLADTAIAEIHEAS